MLARTVAQRGRGSTNSRTDKGSTTDPALDGRPADQGREEARPEAGLHRGEDDAQVGRDQAEVGVEGAPEVLLPQAASPGQVARVRHPRRASDRCGQVLERRRASRLGARSHQRVPIVTDDVGDHRLPRQGRRRDREVDLAVDHPRQQVLVGPEDGGDRRGDDAEVADDQPGEHLGARAHAQRRPPPRERSSVQAGEHAVQAVEGVGDLREESPALLGGHHPVPAPHEQRCARRGLERPDVTGGRRLREVPQSGGLADRARLVGGQEGPQPLRGRHRPTLGRRVGALPSASVIARHTKDELV